MNVDKIKIMHSTRYMCDLEKGAVPTKSFNIPKCGGNKNEGFRIYKKKVWDLTEIICKGLKGIEKRGFKNHHIDHKISIWQGYKSSIPVEYIASLENLRMIPYKENMLKGRKSVY